MAGVLCIGMAVWDRILSLPGLPTAPIKIYASDLTETGGGPAATAACAIARLGGAPRLVARVGADAVGTQIIEELERFGVATSFVARLDGARSAVSSVAIEPGGERLILAFPGQGLGVPPDWVDWDAAFEGIGCVLADVGWPPGAERALKEASARNIPSVLDADLSPHPAAADLVPLADHVVFSAPGLAMLAEEEDPTRALAKVVARRGGYRGSVGVTRAELGYRWMDAAGDWSSPGFPVKAVDTLGAGDVFHGAYALALAGGADLAEAARFANAAAALKCARGGGRLGAPGRAEVEALIRDSG
ncbi:MAG TPA: PfkB family carbohydrate kinase [Falsiroseomonas sp.]|jgi:sulfofructose kinase|nr:PfkB family carbohydrate kinase [Falsiroseomonas sp.]